MSPAGPLDLSIDGRLRIPVIAAPMFLVSNPAMTIEACRAGVIGSFPAHSTRTRDVFDEWLDEIEEGLAAAEGHYSTAIQIAPIRTEPGCSIPLKPTSKPKNNARGFST